MRRTTFDDTREDDALPALAESSRVCMWCKASTPVSVLNHLGARCQRCFDAYCREAQPAPFVPAVVPEGPRRWVHALKAREEGGERLTPVQRSAWREALGPVVSSTADEVQP